MDRELAIIGQIYDATLGEEDWASPLVQLADHCGVENVALAVVDNRLDYASVVAPRADPEIVATYNSQWWQHDPTVGATRAMPVGQLTSLATTGRDKFLRSTFHNEFWSRSGLGAERIATNLDVWDGAFASCVLQPSVRRDEVDATTARRFATFTPHLVRAVTIQRKIQRLTMETALVATAAGGPRAAAMIVDADGRVIFADAAGERLLASGDGIGLKDGRLVLFEPHAHMRLIRAIAAASGAYSDLPANGPVYLSQGERHTDLFIDIMPSTPALRAIDLFSPRPAALLRIHETAAEPLSPPDSPERHKSASGGRTATERESRFAAIKRDVRDNLANPDLSLEWLARRHGTTPRAIRNLFYSENTSFTDWLMNARLDHARDMLTDLRHQATNIATVAYESGFGDLSWFHQVFRRRFGLTPTQMRTKG